MYQPLISIIITVLNGEQTIGACLDSIVRQSFTNYEVVIVDGGSTDRTVDVVEDSQIDHKTVDIVPGLGLYAGLNAGVRLARGQWLYFIGCDDELYRPDTLQKVAGYIASNDNSSKVLVGNVLCVKQDNVLYARFGSLYWMHYHVHHQGMFYARSLFANAFYNETRRIASDYEFNLKLAMAGIPHQAIDLIICNFGGDGISENQAARSFLEMQDVHRHLFHGPGRQVALSTYWLQQRILSVRKRLNLVNLKSRLKRLVGQKTSLT